MDTTFGQPEELTCRICTAPAGLVGRKMGKYVQKYFNLYRCARCGFAFVGNHLEDYAKVYSEEYYGGRGADPLADYTFEIEHLDDTVHMYEWRGILRAVTALRGAPKGSRWLDYGCAHGGLVHYVRAQGAADIIGFEEGWIAGRARVLGVPILSSEELASHKASFDVVTAIEVFEHVADPVAVLTSIRALMKPGGLLFYTTGNAEPHRKAFIEWRYVVPEVHISFFEPATMRRLLAQTGFRAEERGFVPGFEDIIRFKVLKNLHVRKQAAWERVLPWTLISRLANAKYQVTAHPVAWAQ